MGGLKILICDDHEGFRRSLAALLDGAEDVTVAANVADGEAAVEAANALQLDVALMDLTMPGIGESKQPDGSCRTHRTSPSSS